MTLTAKPDERTQQWRTHPDHDDPPPTTDEVRRELGWGPIPYSDEPKEQP